MIVDFPAAAGRLSIDQETRVENRNSRLGRRVSIFQFPVSIFQFRVSVFAAQSAMRREVMSILRNLASGLRALFRKKQVEREMDEELRGYLDAAAKDKMRSGMGYEQALRAARVEMGSVDAVKEEIRSAGWESTLETLWQDVRFALRMLRKSPAWAAVAIFTLGLGIGANTAIFSLANAAFFRSFPFSHADRLAFLWQDNARTGETEGAVSYPNYADWRAQSRTFEDMAFIAFGKEFLTGSGGMAIVTGPNGPERVPGALVSANFFSVLGVNPLLGRGFVTDDALMGHTGVAVISYGFWQERFGGDPHVLEKRIRFGADEDAIIGVLPRGFTFPNSTQIWKPRVVNAFLQTKARQYPNLAVVGRRRTGVTWPQAQAEMDTIAARLATEYASVDGGVGIRVIPLREQLTERVRRGIVVLWGAIAGVLLMACLNTAGLMMSRASSRQKEIAVRLSLGATRWRLARQLLTESSLLAAVGALVGFGLAVAMVDLISRLNPDIARLRGSVLDASVLAYTAAVTVVAAALCSVLPGLTVPGINGNRALKETSATISPSTHATRRAFIVAEVATAFVLLVGSVLLMRSLWRVLRVDPGFDAAHVLAFHVYWPAQAKTPGESTARDGLFVDFMARLRSLPGVSSVGCASFVLFPDEMFMVPFEVEGQPTGPSNQRPLLTGGEASSDFFRTMGIPLLRGRMFVAADSAKDAQPVALINLTMARRYWPNDDPLGKRFEFLDPNLKSTWFTIVGVVGDVRGQGLENPSGLMAYLPSAGSIYDDIVVRTTGDPLALSAAVRREIRLVDKNLIILHMSAASSMLEGRELHREFIAWLLTVFAVVALLLAAAGVYGVLAFWVGQRTQEIGVRMALGAQKSEALRMVVGQGFNLAILGIVFGMPGALALTRHLNSLLYGIKPTDPLTLIAVAVLLVGVALLASYIPARRATKVDPLVALRYE
jgi:putative ABC transport system permease protein